jgi:hypothetical protein
VINSRNAPAYKLAQLFTEFSNNTFDLPYTFNVHHSTKLISDLNQINVTTDIRACSFDIKNIPTHEVINIIIDIANNNEIPGDIITEIDLLMKLIIKQNYFEHNLIYYQQSEELAMGAPSSAHLSEIYLQHLEHNQILDLLIKNKIIAYHRYADDILLVYNTLHTDINKTLIEFNIIHHKIQFTIEEEINNQINFLHLFISRTPNCLQFGIFRKPMATDAMIHNKSCHPTEHKISDTNYLINIIVTYPISECNKNKENQIIDHLLKVNGYHHLNTADLIRRRKQYQPAEKDKKPHPEKMGQFHIRRQ